jgi:hypothetical protein
MSGIYGARHTRLRAKAKAEVDAGNAHCWKCGKWLDPKEPFDLGHAQDMGDPTQYGGPECLRCNRGTARHKAANVVDQSREW